MFIGKNSVPMPNAQCPMPNECPIPNKSYCIDWKLIWQIAHAS
ncbi:MAG: hypothetical protein V7L04_32745 [Nostoc sp.]